MANGDRRPGNTVPLRHIGQPVRELGQERHAARLTGHSERWYSSQVSFDVTTGPSSGPRFARWAWAGRDRQAVQERCERFGSRAA
jgi:hypothetical protein